jgi:hypothetical protein
MVNPTSLLSEVYGARTDAGRSAPSIRVQPPGRALAGWSVPFIADSSMLAALRLLARRVVHPDDLDDQIAFYERALGARCDSRTGIPDARLELVTVANLLLIGNPPPPDKVARTTAFTLLVASAVDYVAGLEGTQTELTEPISTEPSGSRTRVRYPTARSSRSSTADHCRTNRHPPRPHPPPSMRVR